MNLGGQEDIQPNLNYMIPPETTSNNKGFIAGFIKLLKKLLRARKEQNL